MLSAEKNKKLTQEVIMHIRDDWERELLNASDAWRATLKESDITIDSAKIVYAQIAGIDVRRDVATHMVVACRHLLTLIVDNDADAGECVKALQTVRERYARARIEHMQQAADNIYETTLVCENLREAAICENVGTELKNILEPLSKIDNSQAA